MKHLKNSFTLLILLTVIAGSRTFAQDWAPPNLIPALQKAALRKAALRKLEIIQNNEYTITGYEQGNFYNNPLLLNGNPVDYKANLESEGELTVIKGAAITGKATQVPFYVYLRRDGNKILIPGSERAGINQAKMDISDILRYAKPGDQLVIEAIKKEDGPVKRIFKVLQGGGC